MLLETAKVYDYTPLTWLLNLTRYLLLFFLISIFSKIDIREKFHRVGSRIRQITLKFFRLLMGKKYHEKWVWRDLKNIFKNDDWNHGIYENEKLIIGNVHINEHTQTLFKYYINSGTLNFSAQILDSYSLEDTLTVFTLASHLNNLLSEGRVAINVPKNTVTFNMEKEVSLCAIFPENIHEFIAIHYSISAQLQWAFHQLNTFGVDPLDIMIDFTNRYARNPESAHS
jgi:hypothetical protein